MSSRRERLRQHRAEEQKAEAGNPPAPAATDGADSPAPAASEPSAEEEDDTNPVAGEPIGLENASLTTRLMSEYFPRDPARNTPAERQAYIDREVAITRIQLASGKIKTNPIVDGKDRLDRCRDYAEWRWDSYWKGEVASL